MILIVPIACAASLAACGSGGTSTAGASAASADFPPGGGIESLIGANLDPNSPAFRAAAKACGGPR